MHFFEVYKDLENIKTDILKIDGRAEANEVIANCLLAYEELTKDNPE